VIGGAGRRDCWWHRKHHQREIKRWRRKGVGCEDVWWWVLFGGVGVGLEVGLVGGGVVG